MMYSQYCRIEALAGGCHCTHRQFIRAARSKLTPEGKTRIHRDARHEWIRDGLRQLADSRQLYREVMY